MQRYIGEERIFQDQRASRVFWRFYDRRTSPEARAEAVTRLVELGYTMQAANDYVDNRLSYCSCNDD